MESVKNAYAWQEAIELSRRLVEVIEAFSDSGNNVMAGHLREAVVAVPASIAADLQAGRMATMEPVFKVAVELELIRKIYPAIETSSADEQLEKLMTRMQAENFAEREPEPVVDTKEDQDADDGMHGLSEAQVEPTPQPAGGTTIVPQVDGVGAPTIITIEPASENQES